MPDKHGPISALARKLRSFGPPSLSVLIARLGEVEEYADFILLVKEFLPEREVEILGQSTPSAQMAAFASYFEDRYFPLYDYFRSEEVDSYYELTHAIPVIVMGMSWEDYNEISCDSRPGIQLMTYLLESPDEDANISVALAEACAGHVPADLLQRVPEGGFSLQQLPDLLKDTPYEALANWGGIISHDTGNEFLDTDYEMLGYSTLPDWERIEVDHLTRQWQQAELINQGVTDLAVWLEGDPPARFKELLDFILLQQKEAQRKEVKVDGERVDNDKRAKGLSVGAAGGA